jgi:phospholipid/cholesterol/gamma-HCH transport system substrate-binding protein
MHGRGAVLLDNFQSLLANSGFLGPIFTDLGPQVLGLGQDIRAVFSIFPAIFRNGAPQSFINLSRFIGRIQRLLDNNAGDLKVLGEAFRPHIKAIAGALLNFDPAQILSNVVASLPEDGAVTLHVRTPEG